jgi:hypothetical protein
VRGGCVVMNVTQELTAVVTVWHVGVAAIAFLTLLTAFVFGWWGDAFSHMCGKRTQLLPPKCAKNATPPPTASLRHRLCRQGSYECSVLALNTSPPLPSPPSHSPRKRDKQTTTNTKNGENENDYSFMKMGLVGPSAAG